MNLKKATILLIGGSVYTLFHKAIYAIFPFLQNNTFLNNLFSFLWLIASVTIILFAYYFPKEVIPLKRQIKIYLRFVIIFTSIIIILKLPFVKSIIPVIQRNLFFEIIRLLNSITMLLFWISLYKTVNDKFQLHNSLKLLIWVTSFGLLISFVSFGYYLSFILTGNESTPIFPIKYLGIIAFVFTYFALINFLIKFQNINDYKKLLLN